MAEAISHPSTPRDELLARLGLELARAVLPHAVERCRRIREALARGDALLGNSPIGRGEW